jgi:transcriptional regulator with XRE-family HTH domain
VNDLTVGRAIRLLRRRRRWRQRDLADRAGVSQPTISALERGQIDCTPLRTVRTVLDALDATAWLEVSWRGGIIARLLDERHAALVGAVAGSLASWRWEVVPELSYSEYGERGSIDLAAWHADSRTLLVIEVKTELVSVESTLRKLDEKVRLGPKIVGGRLGWRPAAAARLLVLPSDRTQRRHVERHVAVLDRALPNPRTRDPGVAARPSGASRRFVVRLGGRGRLDALERCCSSPNRGRSRRRDRRRSPREVSRGRRHDPDPAPARLPTVAGRSTGSPGRPYGAHRLFRVPLRVEYRPHRCGDST